MSDYVQIDLAGQATPVEKLDEATHISMELHMELVERFTALEEANKRLYGKLTKEVKAKKAYRERAEKAALMGKKPAKSRPKREIVARRDGYFAVHLVELDAETEAEALAEALAYLKEQLLRGRIRRIFDPGSGCWEAEIEVPLKLQFGEIWEDAGAK